MMLMRYMVLFSLLGAADWPAHVPFSRLESTGNFKSSFVSSYAELHAEGAGAFSLLFLDFTIAILSGLVNSKPQLPVFLTILNSLNIYVCSTTLPVKFLCLNNLLFIKKFIYICIYLY